LAEIGHDHPDAAPVRATTVRQTVRQSRGEAGDSQQHECGGDRHVSAGRKVRIAHAVLVIDRPTRADAAVVDLARNVDQPGASEGSH